MLTPTNAAPPPAAPKYQTLKTDVSLGKGQGLRFAKGKGYYAGAAVPTRPATPVATDPLAPLTGAEIANQIAGYTAKMPAPLTDAQIRARAQGMIDPVVAGLTKSATAQGRAASGAISGYANSLANSLASYGDSAKSIYGEAQQGQAAADAAESGAIRGTGTELASQLAGKLAGLGGPAGLDAATSGVVSANGAGGANATLGTGSAALAQLLARGTAAQDEAALQPGIARSQGLADIRDVTLAGNKDLADKVAAATGQLPALVSGLRDQSATRQTNRATAGQNLRDVLEGNNLKIAQEKYAAQKAGLTAGAKVTAAQTTADAKVVAAQNKAIADAAKTSASDAKPSASLSRATGMIVDANGSPIAGADGKPQILPGFKAGPNGTVVKAASPGKAGKVGVNPEYPNLSKSQVVHLRSGIAAAFNGVPEQKDATGKVVQKALPPTDYETAISHAISAGYSRAGATKMANHFYMPGDRGRPKK